jgi:DNA-binding winged helix-turn-helix (wHTH) protein
LRRFRCPEGILPAEGKNESSFPPFIRFDLFELDAKNGQLRRSGLPVDLTPQALKILVLLSARPDQLVTRKEIKETLWPGEAHGDFDARLNFAMKKLREALRDDAERPRYVLTVRSAGYRFIAPVLAGRAPPPTNQPPRTGQTAPNRPLALGRIGLQWQEIACVWYEKPCIWGRWRQG